MFEDKEQVLTWGILIFLIVCVVLLFIQILNDSNDYQLINSDPTPTREILEGVNNE